MRAARGFTLIEILAALTMFAIVGGTLLQLFGSGLHTARMAGEHTHASFLARSKLTEMQSYSHLKPAILRGDFDGGYRWQAALTPPVDTESTQLGGFSSLHLDLTVSWGEGEEAKSLVFKSLLLTQAVEP